MINYEHDFYGWTQEQAALLRAGRLNELDIVNLIEEVETMGRSEKRELESRLTVFIVAPVEMAIPTGSAWSELAAYDQNPTPGISQGAKG